MENEQPAGTPPITTDIQENATLEPALQPSSAPVPPEMTKKRVPWVAILLGVAILMMGAIYGLQVGRSVKVQTPTPSVAPTANPTTETVKQRELAPVATASAFLEIERSIASLSAAINAMNTNDTSLNPPSIELPLGLETK